MTTISAPSTSVPVERGGTPASAFGLLALRIVLGGIFIAAGVIKLTTPQSFSEAIQAFKLVDSDWLVLFGTHALPPIEIIAGIALVLGFWTRPAALIISGLLLVFIAAVVLAIGKGLEGTTCSCFGNWRLICKGTVGWCKVVENSTLTLAGLILLLAGGGRLSLDALLARPAGRS